MDIGRFYTELDKLFAAGQVQEAGEYLREMLKKTGNETAADETGAEPGDDGTGANQMQPVQERLVILNEWIGYCRSQGLEAEGLQAAAECRMLLEEKGLTQEASFVNAWINMATTLCRFEAYEEGLQNYAHAAHLLRNLPETPDILYAKAALDNNMASVYIAMGDCEHALQLYQAAVTSLERHPDSGGCMQELAITYANMSYIPSAREQSLQRMMILLRRRECQEHPDYPHTCAKCASMLEGIADTQLMPEEDARRLTVLAAGIRRGEASV